MIIYIYIKCILDEYTIYSNAMFYLYLSLHQFQYWQGSYFSYHYLQQHEQHLVYRLDIKKKHTVNNISLIKMFFISRQGNYIVKQQGAKTLIYISLCCFCLSLLNLMLSRLQNCELKAAKLLVAGSFLIREQYQ